jgi:hypothetical protein
MLMLTRPRFGLLVAPEGVQVADLRRRQPLPAAPDLPQAIAGLEGSRALLDIVVSDAHCRYLVVDRPSGLRTVAELEAAAQSRFKAVFGDRGAWSVKLGASAFGGADFAAAVDKDMLARLSAEALAAGLRLVSIRPHWVAWAARLRRTLRRGAHWLVCAEGAWVSLGYIDQGQCRHVRVLRLEAGGADVQSLLARERAFVEHADPVAPVWLCGGGAATAARSGAEPKTTVLRAGVLWGTVEASP